MTWSSSEPVWTIQYILQHITAHEEERGLVHAKYQSFIWCMDMCRLSAVEKNKYTAKRQINIWHSLQQYSLYKNKMSVMETVREINWTLLAVNKGEGNMCANQGCWDGCQVYPKWEMGSWMFSNEVPRRLSSLLCFQISYTFLIKGVSHGSLPQQWMPYDRC